MRILIVSYFFPPFNAIGAVRVGKTAKYLREMGYEVKVISAMDQTLLNTLALEIPKTNVIYTKWFNVNKIFEWAFGRKKIATMGYTAAIEKNSLLRRLAYAYKIVFNLPDSQIGWYPYAVSAGQSLIRQWRPDVIVASAMPITSLLVANSLAKKYGIPWVGELRDLWVDNPYLSYYPKWRRHFEAKLERRVLGSACGLVSISDPLVAHLRDRYTCPVSLVMNGFDPVDYPQSLEAGHSSEIHIVYTGMIYIGRRDPSPLFKAMAKLGVDKKRVKVSFYGRYLGTIHSLAMKYDVVDQVFVHEPVAYRDSLRIQAEADVLLLLLWNDSQEKGSYTGKLFEYLGARRPILAIGPQDNVATQLIVDRFAGVVFDSMNEEGLLAQLRAWIVLKKQGGMLPRLPEAVSEGYTRREQTQKLADFLQQCVGVEKVKS